MRSVVLLALCALAAPSLAAAANGTTAAPTTTTKPTAKTTAPAKKTPSEPKYSSKATSDPKPTTTAKPVEPKPPSQPKQSLDKTPSQPKTAFDVKVTTTQSKNRDIKVLNRGGRDKSAPAAKGGDDKRAAPPMQALVAAGLGNELDSMKLAQDGVTERFLKDIKDELRKDNDDYIEQSRRVFGRKAAAPRLKVNPALAVLLPKDDDMLQPIAGVRAQRRPRPRHKPPSPPPPPPPRPHKLGRLWPRPRPSFSPPSRRPPQQLVSFEPEMMPPPPPPPPRYLSEHRPPPSGPILTTPSSIELKSKKKKEKLQKLMKFIKKNKGLLRELIAEKRERGMGGQHAAGGGLGGLGALLKRGRGGMQYGREGPAGGGAGGDGAAALEELLGDAPNMRARPGLRGDQLDMVHARGSKISAMRLRGRVCQRSVLNAEGPKYNAKGDVYQAAFDKNARHREFHVTREPSQVLPICCNCCAKSVLGCE